MKCYCYECNKNTLVNGIPYSMTRMIVCPDCGFKRCPKATNHELACTGCNAPDQEGSRYSESYVMTEQVNRMLRMMLGSDELVTRWWESDNLHWGLKKPSEIWQKDPHEVYAYILNHYR